MCQHHSIIGTLKVPAFRNTNDMLIRKGILIICTVKPTICCGTSLRCVVTYCDTALAHRTVVCLQVLSCRCTPLRVKTERFFAQLLKHGLKVVLDFDQASPFITCYLPAKILCRIGFLDMQQGGRESCHVT